MEGGSREAEEHKSTRGERSPPESFSHFVLDTAFSKW